MKPYFKWLVTLVFFSAALALINFYHVPKIKKWILYKIETISKEKTPVELKAERVVFKFWPPRIELRQVSVKPKGELSTLLLPTQINKVSASISPIGLLKGQLRIGRLLIQDAEIRAFIKSPQKTESKTNINWKTLFQIPIDQIALSRIRLGVDSSKDNFKASIQKLAMRIQNRDPSLKVRILAENTTLKKDNNQLSLNVISEFSVDEKGIYFTGLRLRRESSFLFASGEIAANMRTLEFKKSNINIKSQFNLSEVTLLLRDILGQEKIPALQGSALVTSRIETNFKSIPDAQLSVEASNLSVNQFQIGNLILSSEILNQKLSIQKLKVANAGALIELTNTQLDTEKPYQFKTELVAENVHIQKFLNSIGIKNVPVESRFNVKLPCQGQIEPAPIIQCDGELKNAWIKVNSKKNPIVEFENASAVGTLKATNKELSYKAQVVIGKSRAQTNGTVNYENGFQIQYESDIARFEDFKQLVNLHLKGQTKIKGQTKGTSKAATFEMELDGNEIWFEDYFLGELKTTLSYKTGLLLFSNAQGKINQTQYQGQVRLDLEKDIIDINGKAPFAALEDLQLASEKRVPLPVRLSGTGSATFKIKGPLELSQLSSQINSSFFRGDISGESFDQLHFSFESNQGHLTTNKIQIVKGSSLASLNGELLPSGKMKGLLTAKNFFIDQSEFLKSFNLNISGNLNLEADFGGYFLNPEINARGIINNSIVANRVVNNSTFNFLLTKERIKGKASLFGQSLDAEYNWPYKNQEPYELLFRANSWNFAQYFNIASDSPRPITHNTLLDAELRLEGPQVNLEKTSGHLKISRLFVSNGSAQLQSDKLVQFEFKNGSISNNEFVASHGSNEFKFSTQNSSFKNLNLKIDGRLDLLLVSIVTPFLDDMRGTISTNLALSGPIYSPNLMGSLIIKDGFVRLRNFPHPFEQIRADLLFSQKKLLINSARGRLAGGLFSGSGQVEFIERENIPIDVRGAFQDCVFNVPEGLSTRGSGEFYVHGSKQPYTLGGIYSVYSGSLDKKINAAETTVHEIKASPYLPKFLAEKQVSPIHLDLEAVLQNPVAVNLLMPQVNVKTSVDGRIIIRGPPDATLLNGRLNLGRPSTITVRDNSFNVISGLVEYKNYPPDNPEINVSAEARVGLILKDNLERDYDINARFIGPAQKLNIQMNSQPPLSEQQLISLVTLGYVNETDTINDARSTSQQASSTGYQIGSQFLDEQLGINRRLEKSLGVNFKYSSSFDATNEAKHTFTLKKQWSPRFGTAASRSIGKSETNNVKAEYKLNRNMSVIGSWEGKEQTGAAQSETDQGETNIFGLDIEFKREFK